MNYQGQGEPKSPEWRLSRAGYMVAQLWYWTEGKTDDTILLVSSTEHTTAGDLREFLMTCFDALDISALKGWMPEAGPTEEELDELERKIENETATREPSAR